MKRILSLVLVAALFLGFDAAIYTLITRRCRSNFGDGMTAKMIEVESFLPFDENSEIVRASGETLEGDIPTIDGATALLPIYSAVVNAIYPEESVGFEDGVFTSASKMQYQNTAGAWKALAEGTDDIILVAAPSEKQLEYLAEKGVEVELTPIGREAFVFLVNSENPVDGLSSDEVRKIYSGEITNWKEVGGTNRVIYPLQRKEGSGSQSAMQRFMGETEMKKNPLGILGGAIGFSFRYYVEGIVDNAGVKMLALDGVAPTKENIASGEYPVTNNFFAATRKGETNENVRKVLDFILSEEGQRIVEESGYVALGE